MKKEVLAVAATAAILCVFLTLASAEFAYYSKGSSVGQTYSAGEKIRGVLNMTFSEEPANSLFTSSFNSSIMLYDFLRNGSFFEGASFNCTYKNCASGFKSGEAVTNGGSIRIDSKTSSFVGFKISGSMSDDVSVVSLKFSVTSSIPTPSCERQMIIDVLDKNETFVQNNKNAGVACEEEYSGCFDDGLSSYVSAIITSNPYCERVTLRPAPAYVIGATVKNGTKTTDLKMKLYSAGADSVGDFIGECILPKNSEDTEKLGCNVNFSITTTNDYYVCIEAKTDDAGYKIKVETREPLCGTNTMSAPYSLDYDIYAKPLAFDAIGTLVVNESLFAKQNNDAMLSSYANQYVQDNYGGNCTKGCIIPFRINGLDQDITFSDIALVYEAKGGTLFEESMYKLQKEDSKITTRTPLLIDLEKAGIVIPMNSKLTKFYLYLGGEAISEKPFNVSITPSFDFDITPKTVLAGVETVFSIISPAIILSASWDFGDGTTAASNSKIISHRFSNVKQEGYKVAVEVVRNDGITSRRTFDVSLGSLGESARNLTKEYEHRISRVNGQMSAFGANFASALEKIIELKNANITLGLINHDLANATTDGQYASIINLLLQLDIPYSIFIKEEGNAFPISLGLGNIDVSSIESISGESLDSSDKKESLRAGIVSWMEKNYDGTIDYKIISKYRDESDKVGEAIATSARININRKSGSDESASNAYLIIGYPKNSMTFLQNYSEAAVGSATYVPISGSKTVEFISDGEIPVEELGVYVSPKISELEMSQNVEEAEKPAFNWGRFFLWMSILLIVALAVYIALQEWYKRRYESYLFKNPSDLYNIVYFIFNSRKNGLSDSDISRKLGGTGWKGEQISYAFKKIDGKRTGMWEIPIFKFFEQKKVREEIEKRQTAQKPLPPAAFR